MGGCPAVHEHPEFQTSHDSKDQIQVKEVEKLKRFLKSDSGHAMGEQLKHDLSPFKSFPRGHKGVRCLFILCRDCEKKVIIPNCSFCGSEQHSMDDAVLFYISSDHDKAYKEGAKIASGYKTPAKEEEQSKQ